MKILHLTNTYAPIGGIERYLIALLPLLARRGHENALIYRQRHERTPDTAADEPIFHIPETDQPERDRSRITSLINEIQPDVIYLHDVYDPALIARVAALAPTVGYVHIFYPVCPGLGKLFHMGDEVCTRPYGLGCIPNIYLRRCATARHPRSVLRIMRQTGDYLAAYRQLSRIAVGSRYMRDLMIQNGIPAARVDILPPHFIPPGEENGRAPDMSPPDGEGIIFAGRLEYEKGLPYLLRALPYIQRPHYLIVAGDGTRQEAYRQLAAELGVAERVQFAGWLGADELEAAYQQCAVTVMPTIMPEPFGKVGVEALNRGRPVVAFDVGGIADWLVDGRHGYLIPPRDSRQLAARIEILLADLPLAQQMGRQGQQFVRETYSQETHLTDLLQILSRAAG